MDNYKHYSVLLKESIDLLNIKPDGIYVDCTLGGGGHSLEVLKRLTTGHLYAFDQDKMVIENTKERLLKIGTNFTIINDNFGYGYNIRYATLNNCILEQLAYEIVQNSFIVYWLIKEKYKYKLILLKKQ
mgnify:CR=1 FL=1